MNKKRSYTKKRIFILFIFYVTIAATVNAQDSTSKTFTHADTLRGSITPDRIWWDVLKYDITIKPDYENKTTVGKNIITYKVLSEKNAKIIQIDLQEPLQIDSILFNNTVKSNFSREGNAWFVELPSQKKNAINKLV